MKLSLFFASLVMAMACSKEKSEYDYYKVEKVTTVSVDDGSISVTLNVGSQLWVKKRFDNMLYIDGEAYVSVDSTKSSIPSPLRLEVGGIPLACRHGVFNVNAYAFTEGIYASQAASFNKALVSVIEGKVIYRDRDTISKWVFEVSRLGGPYPYSSLVAAEMAGWKNGKYHFKKISIADFLDVFRAWYRIESYWIMPDGMVEPLENFEWNPANSLEDFIKAAEGLRKVKISYSKETNHVLVEGK